MRFGWWLVNISIPIFFLINLMFKSKGMKKNNSSMKIDNGFGKCSNEILGVLHTTIINMKKLIQLKILNNFEVMLILPNIMFFLHSFDTVTPYIFLYFFINCLICFFS